MFSVEGSPVRSSLSMMTRSTVVSTVRVSSPQSMISPTTVYSLSVETSVYLSSSVMLPLPTSSPLPGTEHCKLHFNERTSFYAIYTNLFNKSNYFFCILIGSYVLSLGDIFSSLYFNRSHAAVCLFSNGSQRSEIMTSKCVKNISGTPV